MSIISSCLMSDMASSIPHGNTTAPDAHEALTFWHKYEHKHLQKMLYRAIHLARNNPDYRLKYPNEARDNPKLEVRKTCHKEAEARILKDHMHMLEKAKVPTTATPARFNRVG